nr:hypothetical protein [Vibrio cholerae]
MNEDLSVFGDFEFNWSALKTIGIMVSIHLELSLSVAKESEVTLRYYISSKALSAKELLNASRSNWSAESMYWILDIGYRVWLRYLL